MQPPPLGRTFLIAEVRGQGSRGRALLGGQDCSPRPLHREGSTELPSAAAHRTCCPPHHPWTPAAPRTGYIGGSYAGHCSPCRLQPSLVLPAHLQSLILGQQAVIPPHLTVFPALRSSWVGTRIVYFE